MLLSCGKQKLVVEHNFENNKWNAFKKVSIDTRIKKKELAYKVAVNIVIDERFNSDDFIIGLSQTNDEGESIYSSYTLPIKNSMGDFIESKNSDSLYIYNMVLRKKTYFNSDSIYHFTFENMMNKFYLEGMHSLSLEIIPL